MTTTNTTITSAAPRGRSGVQVSTVTGSRAAMGYGVTAMAIGAYQAVREDSLTIQIPADVRVMLVVFAVSMLVLVPAHLALGAFARSRRGSNIAAIGTPLLAVGALSSAVNGEDFSWFPVVAVAANALWFVGGLTLAVSLWRAGRVQRWVAAVLPLTMPVTLLLSQIGGGLLAGAFWLAVGMLMAGDRLTRR